MNYLEVIEKMEGTKKIEILNLSAIWKRMEDDIENLNSSGLVKQLEEISHIFRNIYRKI